MRDRYDLHEELGRGAMGVVYRATDSQLKRDVALKVLRPALADEPEAIARFHREVAACAAVAHPNIVRIFDAGESDEGLYYTMELLPAGSLEERLREQGAMPAAALAGVLAQLADALAALHERGIVHRDVKPSNVMLGADDHCTLMDFGLVHLPDRSVLTMPGHIMGTPLFMAPEIWKGAPFAEAADVYALGILAWRAAAGRLPTSARNPPALAAWAVNEGPVPLAVAAPSAPNWFATLVARMLDPDPALRPRAAEVAATCREQRLPRAAEVVKARPRPRPARPARDPRAALAVALALAAGAAWTLSPRQPPPAPPSASAVAPVESWCAVKGLSTMPAADSVLVDFSLEPPCAATVRVHGATYTQGAARRFNHQFTGLAPDTAYRVEVELAGAPPGARGVTAWPLRTHKVSTAQVIDGVARSVRSARPDVDMAGDTWRQLVLRLMAECQRARYAEPATVIADAIDRMPVTDTRVKSWAASTALSLRSGAILRALKRRMKRNEDHDVIVHALLAAHRLGDPSGPDLARRLMVGPVTQIEAGTLTAAAELLPPGPYACALFASAMKRWVQSLTPYRSREAAAAMLRLDRAGARQQFAEWTERALLPGPADGGPKREDAPALIGLYGLAQSGVAADLERLERVCATGSARFCSTAALALAETRPPGAGEALARALARRPGVPFGHWFLGLLDPAAPAAAVPRLASPDAAAGAAAALGLPQADALTAPARDALISALSAPSPDLVTLAAWALGHRRETHARAALRALALSERDPRGIAAWALARTGAPDDLNALAGLVDRLRAERPGAANGRLAVTAAGLSDTAPPGSAARAALDRLAADAAWPAGVRTLAAPHGERVVPIFPFLPQLPTRVWVDAGDVVALSYTGAWYSPRGDDDDELMLNVHTGRHPGTLVHRGERNLLAEQPGELILSGYSAKLTEPWFAGALPPQGGVLLVAIKR